jgi:3-hydroxyisobutyrate dehydrogenase
MKIGFIGLGNMGAPMALNLLKAGNELIVFDVVQKNIDSVVQQSNQKAAAAPSVKALAQHKLDLILTMLPAAQHVRSVYLGSEGLLENVASGVLLVDSSTIDPQTAREVSGLAKTRGNTMLDAPVSGGTGGAQAGTLTFMVGGEESVFNAHKSLFEQMGKNIFYCGASGNGQVAKVSNNMLLGISMIATAEAMALGVELGMDAKVLANIINTSSGRCWSSDTYNPYPGVLDNAPASRGYTGGFGTDLMLKDLGLACEAAKSVKQPVMLGAAAAQIYQTFSKLGNGHLDFSAIIKLFRK